MATDWTSPKTSDTHTEELAATRGRDESNARMDYTGDTNIPDGTIRWNKTNNRFEIWNATTSTWSVLSSKYLINVDTVDGYHAGNASGNVPVSNGTLNINLNADLLDGKHGTFFQARANHTGTQAPSTISPQGTGSGLDADKLDGQHGTYFQARANHTGTQAPSTISPQGAGSGLDADLLDGKHAGNASGNVPVSNGTLNINLNADLLDGKHLSEIGGIWDVIIEDQKPQGCPGGHATSGSWLTRDLNTLVYNYNSLASLNNNIFTLPAGTYCIDWSAPACEVDRHKTRLYNHTTSEMIAYGTAEYTTAGYRISNRSHGIAIVTISTTTSFTIQYICSTSRIDVGLGEQTGTGIEIYTRVCIKKIA